MTAVDCVVPTLSQVHVQTQWLNMFNSGTLYHSPGSSLIFHLIFFVYIFYISEEQGHIRKFRENMLKI